MPYLSKILGRELVLMPWKLAKLSPSMARASYGPAGLPAGTMYYMRRAGPRVRGSVRLPFEPTHTH